VLAAVTTTIAAFLPLMLLPGIVGKFMFVIPFVVTVGLTTSLIEAFLDAAAHVVVLGQHAISRSRTQALREKWTHLLRVKYTRLLIHGMRHAGIYLCVTFALFLRRGCAVGAGLVKFQFFAFDPIRLYYVNVDMPPDAPIEETLRQTLAVEERVRGQLREGEARSVTSLAGIKFTEMNRFTATQYGQIAVSLNPAAPNMRGWTTSSRACANPPPKRPGGRRFPF